MVGSSSDVKRGGLRKVGLVREGGVVVKKPGNAGGAKARQEGGCVESMTKQEELSKVEETPKQGREAESQKWSWVEAEVWTERMLTTLETGVKGGKNAYFIEQGLFTMAVAHAQICQSRRGPH